MRKRKRRTALVRCSRSIAHKTFPDSFEAVSSKSLCYENKIVEAFSWAVFLMRTFDTYTPRHT